MDLKSAIVTIIYYVCLLITTSFMFKNYLSIYNTNNKAVVTLLLLFFIVISSCSIQKIFFADSFSLIENTKQPKATLNLSNNEISCSLNNDIHHEYVLLGENSLTKDASSLLLLFALISGLFISFLRNRILPFKRTKAFLLVPSLPLFLQYRTLII